jgi:hypothetical protein
MIAGPEYLYLFYNWTIMYPGKYFWFPVEERVSENALVLQL